VPIEAADIWKPWVQHHWKNICLENKELARAFFSCLSFTSRTRLFQNHPWAYLIFINDPGFLWIEGKWNLNFRIQKIWGKISFWYKTWRIFKMEFLKVNIEILELNPCLTILIKLSNLYHFKWLVTISSGTSNINSTLKGLYFWNLHNELE